MFDKIVNLFINPIISLSSDEFVREDFYIRLKIICKMINWLAEISSKDLMIFLEHLFVLKKPDYWLKFFDNLLNDVQARTVFSRQILKEKSDLIVYKLVAEKIDLTVCYEVVRYLSLASLNIIGAISEDSTYKNYLKSQDRDILFKRIIFLTSYSMIVDCPIRKISANLNKKLKNLKSSELIKYSRNCRRSIRIYKSLKLNNYHFEMHEDVYICGIIKIIFKEANVKSLKYCLEFIQEDLKETNNIQKLIYYWKLIDA